MPEKTQKVGVNILPDKDASKSSNHKELTLVLDLDETLIHFVSKEKKFKLRPGCLWFLKEMASIFEIVIFTAAAQDYADYILNIIEKRLNDGNSATTSTTSSKETENNKFIDHRLYRHHCQLDDGVFVKDLSMLGRPLNKTIIVDNIRDNFERQPNNGIEILTWIGNPEDRELNKLGSFLKNLANSNPTDIRTEVKKYTDNNWRSLSPSKRAFMKLQKVSQTDLLGNVNDFGKIKL